MKLKTIVELNNGERFDSLSEARLRLFKWYSEKLYAVASAVRKDLSAEKIMTNGTVGDALDKRISMFVELAKVKEEIMGVEEAMEEDGQLVPGLD